MGPYPFRRVKNKQFRTIRNHPGSLTMDTKHDGFRMSWLRTYCIWMFPKIGGKTPKWMVKIKENPIKMGWFGGTTIFGNIHMLLPWWFIERYLLFRIAALLGILNFKGVVELFLGYLDTSLFLLRRSGFWCSCLMVFLMCSHKGHETKKVVSSIFCSPLFIGEDSRFDSYFSNGLKPATRDRSNPQKFSCLPTIHFSGGKFAVTFREG